MQAFNEGVNSARKLYADLGFDTLPVEPGSKECHVNQWQIVSPDEAWLHAPLDSNIAIRCGGALNLAVLDIDEYKAPGTIKNINEYLNRIGINSNSFPNVQSASGIGRHIYFRLDECPGRNRKILKKDIGEGDLRFGPGSYVLAPPSWVGNGNYKLMSGDLAKLQIVAYKDLLPLLNNPIANEIDEYQAKQMSRLARKLLRGLL